MNLTMLDVTSTSVVINWEPPVTFQGHFSHYVLKWRRISVLNCKMEHQWLEENLKNQDVKTNKHNITFLKPYSEYQLNVSAANNKLAGPPKTITFKTLFSNKISEEEFPNVTFTEGNNYTTIALRPAECQKRMGPISLNVLYHCTDVWCKPNQTSAYFEIKNDSVNLESLTPFSQYELQLQFCRNKTLCNKANVVSKSIKTKAAGKLFFCKIYINSISADSET